jgi:hypothetical protein
MSGYQRTPILPKWTFAFAFVATGMFALTSIYPGFVHHDSAEIAMWSTLGWSLGLPKHPPFLPWLFRAVSNVVPLTWASIALLSAANIVLGAWAVWRVAILALGERRAVVAVMLYGLSLAGTFLALKLNHNAILVSIWPLTILAFLTCMGARTVGQSTLLGALFGLIAAISVLAKYYSGVLLISCVIASFVSRDRSRFYRTPGGYTAVLTFLVVMAPHVVGLSGRDAGPIEFALHSSDRETYAFAHFAWQSLSYILPEFVGFLIVRAWFGVTESRTAVWDRVTGVHRCPELIVLAMAPFVISVLFIGAFHLRGAASWSLPDFVTVPLLLAAALPLADDLSLVRLSRFGGAALLAVAVSGPVWLLAGFAFHALDVVEPRAEFVVTADRIWNQAIGHPVKVVAGDPKITNLAAMQIQEHPTAFTYFPGSSRPGSRSTQ